MKGRGFLTVAVLLLLAVFTFVGCGGPADAPITLSGGEGVTFQWYGYSETEAPAFTVRVGETILQPKEVEKHSFSWSASYREEHTPAWEKCWHYEFEQGGYINGITLEMFKGF